MKFCSTEFKKDFTYIKFGLFYRTTTHFLFELSPCTRCLKGDVNTVLSDKCKSCLHKIMNGVGKIKIFFLYWYHLRLIHLSIIYRKCIWQKFLIIDMWFLWIYSTQAHRVAILRVIERWEVAWLYTLILGAFQVGFHNLQSCSKADSICRWHHNCIWNILLRWICNDKMNCELLVMETIHFQWPVSHDCTEGIF